MKPKNTTANIETHFDWTTIHRVLLVRLRSIGDTVLMTPCLTALKTWRPDLHLTVLTERLSAPLLEDHPDVDDLIVIDREMNQLSDGIERLRLVRQLRDEQFDAVFNLHGGTTATFLSYFSRAPERVGYRGYRYSWLHSRRAPDPQMIWGKSRIHSAEQQLGLLKWTGVPIDAPPGASLRPNEKALTNARRRLAQVGIRGPFALLHPAATSESKRWSAHRFAQVAKFLAAKFDLPTLVVGARHEVHIVHSVKGFAGSPVQTLTDLDLKDLIALSTMATLFIGNDSGPAHVAAAVNCPVVVIFGSSDANVWGPWGNGLSEVVHVELDYVGVRLKPNDRIKHVRVEHVTEAVERILNSVREQPELGFQSFDVTRTPV
jgi:lipopolysaccharide heptosyltransferase II